jgi:hypothetical protein
MVTRIIRAVRVNRVIRAIRVTRINRAIVGLYKFLIV